MRYDEISLKDDGRFKRKAIRHFFHLCENILHFLAVGEEFLCLAVHFDGHNTAVFSLLGLDTGLKILHYNR